jgi:DNA polymerase III delta prime subunit
LFHVSGQGPPGTGKTTSIMCLAIQLLGSNNKEAILELNASDDRCGASGNISGVDDVCLLPVCLANVCVCVLVCE